jgi:hypothetical protein
LQEAKTSTSLPNTSPTPEKFEFSQRSKAILDEADYAFTGSYHFSYRNIMEFEPLDLLPSMKGKYHNFLICVNICI